MFKESVDILYYNVINLISKIDEEHSLTSLSTIFVKYTVMSIRFVIIETAFLSVYRDSLS